ncbi:MAG: hypothetical protein KGL74_13410, partial [Elusimicrobia bacterium]|nr:hypothetical protein [Elusimicrobiota bacterium]
RARVDFQNHLIDDRDAILRGCISEYSARRKNAPPPDRGELERMAKEILTPAHEDVATKIVDEVTTATNTREQREKSLNEQTKKDQAAFPHHPEGAPTHTKQATPVMPNNGEAPQ